MFISLGSACRIREAIQRHLNVDTLETNMFDWVLSNFAAVLYFIQHIDEPIIDSDFYDTKIIFLDKRLVNHTKLRFNTIHDCDANLSYENTLPLLLEKYNRRLLRLKNTILNQNKIDFIHLVDCEDNRDLSLRPIASERDLPDTNLYIPSLHEIDSFYEAIRKINPNCNVRLHILIPPTNCKSAKEELHKTYTYTRSKIDKLATPNTRIHYLEQDENLYTNQFSCTHWNWDKIFQDIDK